MSISARLRSRRSALTAAVALGAAVALATVGLVTAPAGYAATGCQVTYRVNAWSGGFVGYVGVSGGDQPLHGWTVTWTWGGDQRITSAWNATVGSNGAAVTAVSMPYNGEVAANASTEFGVQGVFSASNPSPTNFAVNGVPCNGAAPTSAAPSSSRPPTSAPPTSAAPTASRPPTSAPPTTAVPTTSRPPTSAPPTTGGPGGCGGAYICDGFEGQTGSTPSGAWTVANRDCSGTGTAAIDTSVARSGGRSLRINGGEGYCNHEFVRSSTALTGTVWYARFYLRHTTALPAAHVTFVAMRDTADGNRDLRMGGQNARMQWNRESDDQTLPVQSPTGVALSVAIPTNTWTCVEFVVNGGNGQMQTWVNGTEVPGLHEDGVATADIDSQWVNSRPAWRPALADFRIGWESYGVGADTLWFDDVAVGSSRIGC
jgi:hypothetical protein